MIKEIMKALKVLLIIVVVGVMGGFLSYYTFKAIHSNSDSEYKYEKAFGKILGDLKDRNYIMLGCFDFNTGEWTSYSIMGDYGLLINKDKDNGYDIFVDEVRIDFSQKEINWIIDYLDKACKNEAKEKEIEITTIQLNDPTRHCFDDNCEGDENELTY